MPPSSTTSRKYLIAAFYALSGFTLWTFSDVILKIVKQSNVPLREIFLISGVSGMVVMFVIAAARGKLKQLQAKSWGGLLAIGLCQWFSFVCWVAALPNVPLVKMYVVSFMTPLVVAILAALILKEKLGWRRAVAIAAGFVGVVVSVDPMTLIEDSGSWAPYMAVFGSMAGTAAQMLVLRVVSQKEGSECTAFYPRAVISVVGLVACIPTGFEGMPPWVFMALCAQGALGAFGWLLMAQAYKNAPAAVVAPFHYSQLITGAIMGYLVFDNVPDNWLMAGAVIIVASGIYFVRNERRSSRTMNRS